MLELGVFRLPGRQEGELAAVLKRLTWRLGAVEAKVRSRLQQLASTQLEELANLTFRVVNLILAIRDRSTSI